MEPENKSAKEIIDRFDQLVNELKKNFDMKHHPLLAVLVVGIHNLYSDYLEHIEHINKGDVKNGKIISS